MELTSEALNKFSDDCKNLIHLLSEPDTIVYERDAELICLLGKTIKSLTPMVSDLEDSERESELV